MTEHGMEPPFISCPLCDDGHHETASNVCSCCGLDLSALPPVTATVTIEQVAAAASEVYKPEGVTIWLDAPNRALYGATPRQYVAAGDGEQVLALIERLAGGAFA